MEINEAGNQSSESDDSSVSSQSNEAQSHEEASVEKEIEAVVKGDESSKEDALSEALKKEGRTRQLYGESMKEVYESLKDDSVALKNLVSKSDRFAKYASEKFGVTADSLEARREIEFSAEKVVSAPEVKISVAALTDVIRDRNLTAEETLKLRDLASKVVGEGFPEEIAVMTATNQIFGKEQSKSNSIPGMSGVGTIDEKQESDAERNMKKAFGIK